MKSVKLYQYMIELIRSFEARARNDEAAEEAILHELDCLWLSMTESERQLSDDVATVALKRFNSRVNLKPADERTLSSSWTTIVSFSDESETVCTTTKFKNGYVAIFGMAGNEGATDNPAILSIRRDTYRGLENQDVIDCIEVARLADTYNVWQAMA